MKVFQSAIDGRGVPFTHARLAALVPVRAFWETTVLLCPLCNGPITALVTNADNLAFAIVCKNCDQNPPPITDL